MHNAEALNIKAFACFEQLKSQGDAKEAIRDEKEPDWLPEGGSAFF